MVSSRDGKIYKKKIELLLRLTWLKDYKSKLMRKLFNKSNWKLYVYNQIKSYWMEK